MGKKVIRKSFTVRGQVQGVGFRPFVWHLAQEHSLSGFVRNTSHGVKMEFQGPESEINALMKNFWERLPPRALVTGIDERTLEVIPAEKGFEILASQGLSGQNILAVPDLAPCMACLAEMRNPENPRFHHPFISCTDCGPRFSIIARLPYDRASTTMGCFPPCTLCASEYAHPENRRFHAQPVACPDCGPQLWFVPSGKNALHEEAGAEDALNRGAALLKNGKILALKGMGGYQLACLATHSCVEKLRQRKSRPHKAFAVMVKNIACAGKICRLTHAHIKLLQGPERPIVFAKKRRPDPLSASVAPDSPFIGVMLPATPLHELLFDALGCDAPLIMTSANAAGEPLCAGNREAFLKLGDMADGFLMHNRDILSRVDDSIAAVRGNTPSGGTPVFFRRARGYVPGPVKLASGGPPVLGAGAELKVTFCLTRGSDAFLSQHIGDMENPAAEEFYRQTLAHFERLLEIAPEIVVHDLHPDFTTTRFASLLARERNLPTHALQHHAAHAAAFCAQNFLLEPALVFCLDGSGLGTDGSIWGGELILMDCGNALWKRVASFAQFELPGGDAAILAPWRIARAMASTAGLAGQPENPAEAALDEMLAKRINCIPTSSCGRLFDAVSAQLGLCHEITYEGQAALRLENCAALWLENNPLPEGGEPLLRNENGLPLLDAPLLFAEICAAQKDGVETGKLAALFHMRLARSLAALLHEGTQKYGISRIGLCGGVMQNILLGELMTDELQKFSLEPLAGGNVPAGDGGIALGQAYFGQRLWNCSRI